MPLTIACGNCGKKYQVGEQVAGKQVRCQGCGTVFVAAPPSAKTSIAELDQLDDLTLAPLPAATSSQFPSNPGLKPASLGGGSNSPLGAPPSKPAGNWWEHSDGSNLSGGPSDSAMRLGSAAMILIGCFLLAMNFFLDRTQGAIYLAPVFLAPLALILGIAGVINPNVVRAAGKYGKHLPWQYKAIAAGLAGLYLVVLVLLAIVLYSAGYFRV